MDLLYRPNRAEEDLDGPTVAIGSPSASETKTDSAKAEAGELTATRSLEGER